MGQQLGRRARAGSADASLDGGHEAALALVTADLRRPRRAAQRLLDVDRGAPLVAEQRQTGVGQREAGVDGRCVLQGDLGAGLHAQQGLERGAVGDGCLGRGADGQAVAVARAAADLRSRQLGEHRAGDVARLDPDLRDGGRLVELAAPQRTQAQSPAWGDRCPDQPPVGVGARPRPNCPGARGRR